MKKKPLIEIIIDEMEWKKPTFCYLYILLD